MFHHLNCKGDSTGLTICSGAYKYQCQYEQQYDYLICDGIGQNNAQYISTDLTNGLTYVRYNGKFYYDV